jgi:hypothetical protein
VTPSEASFIALRVNKGIALADFRQGRPVRCYSLPALPADDANGRALLWLDWAGWSGVWKADEVVIEAAARTDPDDAELLALLGRATNPTAAVSLVGPRDWKAEAGGPFVSRRDVHAHALARWPGLKVPNADAAVALWIGAARLAGRSRPADGPAGG